MTTEHPNIVASRRYLDALARGAQGEELAQYFTSDVVQHEFPNRLVPTGTTRDLAALLEAAERGKQAMSAQRYVVTNAIAVDERVALEIDWEGTLAVPLGSLPVGGIMRARFAVFLEFQGGKIAKQHNYDCFEPW